MATADFTREISNKKVTIAFIRARTVSLFPLFRNLNQMMLSPISLNYVHAMARGAVQDEQLKNGIMDLKLLEISESVDRENFFNTRMSSLLSDLNSEGLASRQSVRNNLFYKNCDLLPENYLAFWNSYYRSRVVPSKRRRKVVKVTNTNVNVWVSEQSRCTINHIISENELDKCTGLLLVNCVYFSGNWNMDYKKKRIKRNIYRSTILDCTIFVSPLAGSNLSMAFGVMDNFDNLLMFFENQSPNLYFLVDERIFKPSSIQYWLPLGVFRSDTSFPHLIFHHDANDVGGFRYVTQKVYLEITDKGITASAVTVLSQSVLDITKEKEAPADTKPTVFIIYNTIEKVVLFMGSNLHT